MKKHTSNRKTILNNKPTDTANGAAKPSQSSVADKSPTPDLLSHCVDKIAEAAAASVNFYIPPDYVRNVARYILAIIPVTVPPATRFDMVARAVVGAVKDYTVLRQRAGERVACEFRKAIAAAGITDDQLWETTTWILSNAVNERGFCFRLAPVWLDTFNDVLWPLVKCGFAKYLKTSVQVDDDWYKRWVKEGRPIVAMKEERDGYLLEWGKQRSMKRAELILLNRALRRLGPPPKASRRNRVTKVA